MSAQTYNRQMITQYLLGALPEAYLEQFDELSITDDEFAHALQAAENDLVDSYAQGELSGAELEQFKSHYLASPLRCEKARIGQAFSALAETNVAIETTKTQGGTGLESIGTRKKPDWFGGLSSFITSLAWQWGTAVAALTLLVVGGWLLFDNTRLRRQISQTRAGAHDAGGREQELQRELEQQRLANAKSEQELAQSREDRERLEQELKNRAPQIGQQPPSSPGAASVASFILVPQLRGAGEIQTITVSSEIELIAMRLDLEPNDHSVYRVSLVDQASGRNLWQSGRVNAKGAGNRKTLSLSFSADLLKPQVYVLRVSGILASGGSEIVGDYPFRVVK